MSLASRQAEFLCRLQSCINRYQPVLESEFQVALGAVTAKPLRVRGFIHHCFEKAARKRELARTAEQSRSLASLGRIFHLMQMALLWVPAYALVYIRFALPELVMKWLDEPPTVAVWLSGWSMADYEKNTKHLDQWTVHELSHGIWLRIARDGYDEYDGQRWVWNEGFAHYVADVHLRGLYPSDAIINEDWPARRREGKQRVSRLVEHFGESVLREIPLQWREFDTRSPT